MKLSIKDENNEPEIQLSLHKVSDGSIEVIAELKNDLATRCVLVSFEPSGKLHRWSGIPEALGFQVISFGRRRNDRTQR